MVATARALQFVFGVALLASLGIVVALPKKDAAPKKTCFRARLWVDAKAVPLNKESIRSFGLGLITVTDTSVLAEVNWHIPGVDLTNLVIGMHIHTGDSKTNGPIIVGFCGSTPLPAFSGLCSQGTTVHNYQVEGLPLPGPGATLDAAIEALTGSADPSKGFYLNVHTTYSFDKNGNMPLGLIRGQLENVACVA